MCRFVLMLCYLNIYIFIEFYSFSLCFRLLQHTVGGFGVKSKNKEHKKRRGNHPEFDDIQERVVITRRRCQDIRFLSLDAV